MATKTASTVAEIATLPPEEKRLDGLQDRLFRYRTSTAIFCSMVGGGVLTEADYQKCCDILAQKYGISLGGIFR